MALHAPFLSMSDPLESSEGSIDPLSFQPTYGRLAERVYPYMTVRMARPRFLTAIAMIARVCEELKHEVAADGVTPAWLVAEWYVVKAFVRLRKQVPSEPLWGLPGSSKVEQVLRTRRKLCRESYLKTPQTFGFTGVYKTLARGLEIVSVDDLTLDDGGCELLQVWEREQGLTGFFDGSKGRGEELHAQLRSAVEKGLRNGYTAKRNNWPYWDLIATHLDPGDTGKREAAWLQDRLLNVDLLSNPHDLMATEMRREIYERLESGGKAITSLDEEAMFFREAIRKGSGVSEDLRERLRAIDAYESLCRPAEDAFRLIRYLSTQRGSAPVSEREFVAAPLGPKLAERAQAGAERIQQAFSGTEWENEVRDLVDRYGAVENARSLYQTILEHHEEVQRAKLPDGKRPWVEGSGAEGVVVRTQYRIDEAPANTDSYVRDYRSSTASQFLQDLRRLPR